MNNYDKIFGAFFGLIIADMIAFPLKFEDYHYRKKFFPISGLVEPFGSRLIKKNILIKSELKNKLSYWFPAGFASVNSQLPLLVAHSIYELNDLDIEDISQKLVKYSFPRDKFSPLGIFRGHSKHLYDTIQNIINGLPLKVCGTTNRIADCIVSTMPIGLYYESDYKLLKNKSIDLALLFYKDYQGIGAASALSYAVSVIYSKKTLDTRNLLLDIAEFTKQSEELASKKYGEILKDSAEKIHSVSESIKELSELINQPLDKIINHYKNLCTAQNISMNSPIPVICVSLYLCLNNQNKFMGAIKACIESDLPIDIVAPIVGALVGITSHKAVIPTKCSKIVRNVEKLEMLSKHLHSKDKKKPIIKNFYLEELEFSTKQILLKQIKANQIERM